MNHTVEIIWHKHPHGNWPDSATDKIPYLSAKDAEILREMYSKIALVRTVNIVVKE